MARRPTQQSKASLEEAIAVRVIEADHIAVKEQERSPAIPEQPLQLNLTTDEVIANLSNLIDDILIEADVSLAVAGCTIDAKMGEILAMAAMAEGDPEAARMALRFIQTCLPYIETIEPPSYRALVHQHKRLTHAVRDK
jgi:hypothetical protein